MGDKVFAGDKDLWEEGLPPGDSFFILLPFGRRDMGNGTSVNFDVSQAETLRVFTTGELGIELGCDLEPAKGQPGSASRLLMIYNHGTSANPDGACRRKSEQISCGTDTMISHGRRHLGH